MNGGSDPIDHIIFRKTAIKTFRTINVNIALTDVGFWLRSAQNCKKCTFLGNLRTIAQEIWKLDK